MKKLISIIFAAASLAACNDKTELGPEHRAEVKIDKIAYSAPIPDTDVEVTCDLSCEYGIYSAWIDYQIDDDPEVQQTGAKLYDGSDKTHVTWHYAATIPGQPAGTKISFRIFSYTPYGKLTIGSIVVYTVSETEPAEISLPNK